MELAGLEPAISVPRATVPRMSGGIHPASSSRYPSESSARKISLYITPQTKGGCAWPRSSMGLRACLKSFDKNGRVGDNRKKQAGDGGNASIPK